MDFRMCSIGMIMVNFIVEWSMALPFSSFTSPLSPASSGHAMVEGGSHQ